ncbi:MAG: sigma-70 family RNA polymerase sigma factor [Candidatus Dormibacteraceae bacterium]
MSPGRAARTRPGAVGRRPDGEERRELLARVADGDRSARESLLATHLDLVLAVARERSQVNTDGLSSADLFQEGTIGLLAAIDAYATSGVGNFESFARSRIASEMDAAQAAEEDARQQNREVVAAAEAYERAEMQFRREHGRQATVDELAHLLVWSGERTEEVARLVDTARRQHDEDLLQYLDTEDVGAEDLQRLLDERGAAPDPEAGDEPSGRAR